MLRKIEKPDISNVADKELNELLSNDHIRRLVQKSLTPYSHWEKIKHWQTPEALAFKDKTLLIRVLLAICIILGAWLIWMSF